MNQSDYWGFFSHPTDADQLANILNNQYGINCELDVLPDIEEIYQTALQLCQSLGGTLSRYGRDLDHQFLDICSSVNTHLLEYLVTDALFHIRKESCQEKYNSRNDFFNKMDTVFKDADIKTFCTSETHFGKLSNCFFESVYRDLLEIDLGIHYKKNKNKEIPTFMDRLLFLLICNATKNPYVKMAKEGQKCSASSIETFFLKHQFYEKVQSLYMNDIGNQCIASYLVDRLFDIDTIIYLSEKLLSWNSLITHKAIFPYFLPIFFIPNTFGKRAYLDLMWDVACSSREKTSLVWDWTTPPNVMMHSAQQRSKVQIEERNLALCKQYCLFLSTVYLPLVNTCFYTLLKRACRLPVGTSEDILQRADQLLMKYLNTQDHKQKYEKKRMRWTKALKDFNLKQKQNYVVELYFQIHAILSNPEKRNHWKALMSVNYVTPQADSRKNVIKEVIKAKLQMNMVPISEFDTPEAFLKKLETVPEWYDSNGQKVDVVSELLKWMLKTDPDK